MPCRSQEFVVWKLSLCVTVLSVLPLGAPFGECPKGWHYYEEGQQCFLLDPAPPLSWEKARAMCKSYGADLTTIPDSKTNTFVKGLIKPSCENYWIGLHDTRTENVFQWLEKDGEANFTYWAPDEPNNFGDEDCVYISGLNESQWNDAVCTTQLAFSCQQAAKTNDSVSTPTPEHIRECPKGWHFYQERRKCFHFDPLSPLSWEAARNRCKSYGGDLTTIPDSKTNTFIKGLVKSRYTDYWIGLHDSAEENVFQWLDDVGELNFTYWGLGEPNNLGEEDCVCFSGKMENRWNDAACSIQIGFSCQKDARTKYTHPAPETTEKKDLVTSPSVQNTTVQTTTRKRTTPKPRKITYRVFTTTGCRRSAGTNAAVHIYIRGKRGSTRKLSLDRDGDPFEQGYTDTFYLRARDLGPLTLIYIGHDNTGSSPAWYLETVTIKRYPNSDDAICLLKHLLEREGNLRNQTLDEAICDESQDVNSGNYTKLLDAYQVYEEYFFESRSWIPTADYQDFVALRARERRIILEMKAER